MPIFVSMIRACEMQTLLDRRRCHCSLKGIHVDHSRATVTRRDSATPLTLLPFDDNMHMDRIAVEELTSVCEKLNSCATSFSGLWVAKDVDVDPDRYAFL